MELWDWNPLGSVKVAAAGVFLGEVLGRWEEAGQRARWHAWLPLKRVGQEFNVGDMGAPTTQQLSTAWPLSPRPRMMRALVHVCSAGRRQRRAGYDLGE